MQIIKTICAHCGRFLGARRFDNGTAKTTVVVSHGLCRECGKKHYPVYYKEGE